MIILTMDSFWAILSSVLRWWVKVSALYRATELKHCILAHHGELEYGSPKKPALLEALALNFADNTDAKMETMIEALQSGGENKGWLGYNRLLESNIRKTTE